MKKIINVLKIICVALIFNSCHSQTNKNCTPRYIKLMYTDPGYNNHVLHGYCHVLVFRNYQRECLDSIYISKFVKNYIDTVSEGKPIDMIKIYNSEKYFQEGEESLPLDAEKDLVLVLWMNVETKIPYKYTFVDQNGKEIYEGSKWIPAK